MGIAVSHSTEGRRQELQTRLDSLKSSAERNKWGQFATPPQLALSLARYARGLTGEGAISFLDPAIGTGSFYSAITQAFPPNAIKAATGVELDPLFAETALKIRCRAVPPASARGDFTKNSAPVLYSELINAALVMSASSFIWHREEPPEDAACRVA